MRVKLGPQFFFDCISAGLLPVLGFMCYVDLMEGNPALATGVAMLFLWNLYSCRRLFDFLLTGFCMWWVARKAREAIKLIDEVRKNINEKSN